MDRRHFLVAAGLSSVATAFQATSAAFAKEIRQKLKRVGNSVGKQRRVRINGEKAWHFTLTPDRREKELAHEKSGRQREELRDQTSNASGTVRY